MKQLEKMIMDEPEWGHFFQMLCEGGIERLRAQAWQFHQELKGRGWEFPRPDVEDALMEFAVELLPDSPAGAEDPRQVLHREMVVWASRQPREVRDRLRAHLDSDEYQVAWEAGLNATRKYLRTKCQAALTSEAA